MASSAARWHLLFCSHWHQRGQQVRATHPLEEKKCGRRSKISSSWFQRDKTLWCTLDSGLLLVLVMRRMFESWSLQVLSSLFSQTINQKNPWICSEPCFILDPQRLPCFSKCVEVWSHFARSGLQLLGLSKKKSLKEQEERKQEEDGFRKRGQVQLKNVLSPREVELVNEVQGRCLVPTMCWIYQRLFWPVFQGRWWTPQYSRSSLRSMDQLSLVSVLPTAVSQSLCSPLCSVMFFTNGCTARICAILSVKSQTVVWESSIFMVYLMPMPFTSLTVKSCTVRSPVSSFPSSLFLSELLCLLYNYIFTTNLICVSLILFIDVMWFWEMVTTYWVG